MPTYPNYHGDLPVALNPLNLRHYFLLAYWVYFRPNALAAYLCQGQRDLPVPGSARKISNLWRIPSHRSVFVMLPGMAALLSALLGLPVLLAGAAAGCVGPEVCWSWAWISVLALVMGIVGGAVWPASAGAVHGAAVGATLSVAFIVARAVWFSTGILDCATIVFLLLIGTRATFSTAFFLFALWMPSGYFSLKLKGYAFLRLGGWSAICWIASLRSLFYPLQCLLAWLSRHTRIPHPVVWDDLVILPLPGTQRALSRRMAEDRPEGLKVLATMLSNPFQRWAVQRVLVAQLHASSTPLHDLYRLLAAPELQCYLSAARFDWQHVAAARDAVLAELGGLDSDAHFLDREFSFAWKFTRFLRDRRVTPLTRFAAALSTLSREWLVSGRDFVMAPYAEAWEGVRQYPGGPAVADAFNALLAFSQYRSIQDLAGSEVVLSFPESEGVEGVALLPSAAVRTALARLVAVCAEAVVFRDTDDSAVRLASLARASAALADLDAFVVAEGILERFLFQRIIRCWQQMIVNASNRVKWGRPELSPGSYSIPPS
ncbi:MAG: hypothetical protein JXA21_13290 [Anaerolineae bacterium]|nr:hypothetical protein [Anaerolineae bacterium]